MAVKIRLTRVGKKRQPSYRVVVADSRSPRDGRYIEQIGRYDPTAEPSIVEIDNERAAYWMSKGAQPSSQVRKLLEIAGNLPARPIKDRRVHVVGEEAQMKAAEETAPEEMPAADEAMPAADEAMPAADEAMPAAGEMAGEEMPAAEMAAEEKVIDMASDDASDGADEMPAEDEVSAGEMAAADEEEPS